MSDFLKLHLKRNRGWPWPEDSWGLTPMFGPSGWCRSCGVPKRPQIGSLVLQRKGMNVVGAWVPYWIYDVICVASDVAEAIRSEFDVDLMPVQWHKTSPGQAFQIVIPTVGESWFDPDELRDLAERRHGVAGARCLDCGVWRWMPLPLLPALRVDPPFGNDTAIAASPEWFGDGWQAFRVVVVRRDLAELLVSAAPKDFQLPPGE